MTSANYTYVPERLNREDLVALLRELGVQDYRPMEAPSGDDYYALSTENYWIDFEVPDHEPLDDPVLSIRIAHCNPLEMLPALRNLFEVFLERGGGYIVDSNNAWDKEGEMVKRGRHVIRDEVTDENWEYLETTYLMRRAMFRKYFSETEAAIPSGDYVGRYLRERGER